MQLFPRVLETTTTTGTGDLTLDGTSAGFVTFASELPLNQYFPYCIEGQTPGEWETGIGYLSASATLVRDTVKNSSNADALVSFSAGTKNVFLTYPDSEFLSRGMTYAMTLGWGTY